MKWLIAIDKTDNNWNKTDKHHYQSIITHRAGWGSWPCRSPARSSSRRQSTCRTDRHSNRSTPRPVTSAGFPRAPGESKVLYIYFLSKRSLKLKYLQYWVGDKARKTQNSSKYTQRQSSHSKENRHWYGFGSMKHQFSKFGQIGFTYH